MAEPMVRVSLLGPVGYKADRDAKVVRYKRGIREMPLSHAQALGLLHRIVEHIKSEPALVEVTEPQLFDGAFDEKLTAILNEAGFVDTNHLAGATEDQLRAIKGVGPANYERIQAALGRLPLEPREE